MNRELTTAEAINRIAEEKWRVSKPPRRWMTDPTAIDSRMRQDIAEIYVEQRVVCVTDLIRRGWTSAQIEAWRDAQPDGRFA